ncbi:MAG: hydroxyethylthiazole kinase [Candidatus Fermentibacteraceae bacterium]|nr:hydroxyethylthiazole kinase [Candidatus Fermentibacteraceae bacterium]
MKPADIICRGLDALRARKPMVHHITNSVVMNFTANVTLCLGAAPVMAPCIDESLEMVRYAGALLLNIGTLDPVLVESMLAAGRAANENGIPVVFDPVGAGATALRTGSALRIADELHISILRGNAGEVLALAGHDGKVRGVDSMDSVGEREELISRFAGDRGLVVAVTGATDIVTDGRSTAVIENGHPLMGRVTGTGCAATTSAACFAAVMDDMFEAAFTGIAAMGIAGEIAAEKAGGPGTFVPLFLDGLAGLDEGTIRERIRASVNG